MADRRQAHFPGQATIDSYGDGGFRFADMSHVGAILILPSGIYGWQPQLDEKGLPSVEAFRPVFQEADIIDVFLFGTGNDIRRLGKDVHAAFKEAGIVLESMATGAAARTFNILLLEKRPVAAALLPSKG